MCVRLCSMCDFWSRHGTMGRGFSLSTHRMYVHDAIVRVPTCHERREVLTNDLVWPLEPHERAARPARSRGRAPWSARPRALAPGRWGVRSTLDLEITFIFIFYVSNTIVWAMLTYVLPGCLCRVCDPARRCKWPQ